MPTASVVVATKQEIVTLLTSAFVDETEVEVAYAWREGLKPEHVVLGQPEDVNHKPASMKTGRMSRNERFVIPVYCVVDLPGSTIEEAEVRATEIAAIVEDALADAKKTASNLWAVAESVSLDSGATSNGSGAQVTVRVSCMARLT